MTNGRRVRRARFVDRSLLPVAAACVVANGVRETLAALLHASGFELRMGLEAAPACDMRMLDDVARIQRLTPEQRLIELGNASRFFAAAERI